MRRIPRGSLILASLVILIVFSIGLYNTVDYVDRELFMAQWTEKVRAVNLFCDEVDRYVVADDDWLEFDYISLMRDQVQDLDAWPSLFAALFNDDLDLLTDRVSITGEPLLYPLTDGVIRDAVYVNERCEFSTIYRGLGSNGEEVRVYFRWIPTGKGYDHKLLFMIAMRVIPLSKTPSSTLTIWCALLIGVTGLLNLLAGVFYAVRLRGSG